MNNKQQSAPQGTIDMSRIDTNPGAACIFAPGAGQVMDASQYRALMRVRWKKDISARQQMLAFARRLNAGSRAPKLGFVGPHAGLAREILDAINQPGDESCQSKKRK